MADITYYASINDPSYNFIDGNGNATTAVSTTTSTISVSLKNNDVLYDANYSNRYDMSASSMTFISLNNATSVDEEVNSLRVQNDTMTILMAVPPDYSMSYETHAYKTAVKNPFSPARKFSRDSNGDNSFLLAYRNTYTKSAVNISSAYDNVSINDSNGSLLTTTQLTKIISSSEVSSSTFNDASSYSIDGYFILTRESSDKFVSKTYVDKTWYGTLTNTSATMGQFECSATYSAQDDGLYTIYNEQFKPRFNAAEAVGILNRNITNQSSWATYNTYNYYTNTMTMKGVVADRDGNVYYGDIYGKGAHLLPDVYTTFSIPAIITGVANKVKVGTVDTSWFNTLSTRTSSSNTYATSETYVEFNNHGIDDPVNGEGGSFFMSTYTWVSLSKYSTGAYSTRASSVSVYAIDHYEELTSSTLGIDAAISFVEYRTIYDNKCSFSPSVMTSTYRNARTYSGKTSTSQSFNSISSSSELNKTAIAIVSTYTGSMYASAYNDGVSVTNTASTTYTATMSSTSSISYANTSTESCEVTSYINRDGYSYYTSFTGELAGIDSYGYQYLYTSWIQSAINESSTYEYRNGLSQSIVKRVYKTFGDPINSTTVSQESLLSSTVYRYTSKTSGSTITHVSSYTNSSANIPEEHFSTYCTTYKDITSSWTYEGPDKDSYYGSYSFNVTVTSVGSYSGTEYVGSSSTSSSRLNTIDYGGTTYRLSDLISSKSWINVGNTNFTENYLYDYSVSSMFSFNDTYIKSLSTYTTRLATSYTQPLDTRQDYNSYSATRSTSLVGISTGDRFIDRVEISRTYTSSYSVSNTVVYYNGSTLDTISSRAELYDTSSEQDVSTVSRTFISSPSDLTTSSLVINSTTETAGRGSFVYSSRELVASTSEQQNDTLVFASTFNTYSFYNSSYTTSTLNTVENTLSATTYEDWYNPVSWTETALSIATSTGVTETVVTNSGVVSVTQSVTYTPVYSTVDGVYVTA